MQAVPNATPPIWNSGSAVQTLSSGVSFRCTLADPDAALVIAPWLNMAPLGEPVVPDVYLITAVSPTSIVACLSLCIVSEMVPAPSLKSCQDIKPASFSGSMLMIVSSADNSGKTS